MSPGNQLASLISALFVLRLVMVRFLHASNVASRQSDHHWQNFEGQFCYQRRNWDPLTSCNSHSVCAIPLGLQSYLRNGGRSRVERTLPRNSELGPTHFSNRGSSPSTSLIVHCVVLGSCFLSWIGPWSPPPRVGHWSVCELQIRWSHSRRWRRKRAVLNPARLDNLDGQTKIRMYLLRGWGGGNVQHG